jgi:mannose-6-phosphate isomerase-like protein (cupin superfamily)
VHETDAEAYYFLSGIGEYSDGESTVTVGAGDVTFTPRGEGHGVRNAGNEALIFLALSVV